MATSGRASAENGSIDPPVQRSDTPAAAPQLDPSEAAAIAAAARNPASVLGGGLNMCGVRYMVLRSDDGSIYVRKGSDGACIAKTNQCVLIGLYGQCPFLPSPSMSVFPGAV